MSYWIDPQIPLARKRSDDLHARVRRFAELWENPPLVRSSEEDDFETLALEIARFQVEHSPGFARLVDGRPDCLEDWRTIPAVPAEAFRLARVALHPSELDAAVFQTSGTTQAESGKHPVRELRTYDELSLRLARHTLFAPFQRPVVVVALAPRPETPERSSLGHMMRLFIEHFDGRALVPDPRGLSFRADAEARWLSDSSGIDLEGLLRAAKIARHRSEPLVVLATSFALVTLLDALDGDVIPTPEHTVVMLTGGFKGRTREVSPQVLRKQIAHAFRTKESCLLSEYGMTELTSQLYEAWPHPAPPSPAPNAVAEALHPRLTRYGGRPGIFYTPPWLRVGPVHPITGLPLSRGEVGPARFVDLGNIDSAIAVQTEDLIRETEDGGIELLGRAARARARGCSLPFEGFIQNSAHVRRVQP